MHDSEDTGEYLAADVQLSTLQAQANGHASRVTELEHTLAMVVDLVHVNYHGKYKDLPVSKCKVLSCRLATNALTTE